MAKQLTSKMSLIGAQGTWQRRGSVALTIALPRGQSFRDIRLRQQGNSKRHISISIGLVSCVYLLAGTLTSYQLGSRSRRQRRLVVFCLRRCS
ncbi:hypothetical protein BDW68DRAFT_13466 [Aspergillus falconensis]